MDTYHAAFWSSDPSRYSSSEEEDEIPYRNTHNKRTKQRGNGQQQRLQDSWTWEEILDGKGPWTQAGEYRRPKAELEAAKAERRWYEEAARWRGWKPERQPPKFLRRGHTGSVAKAGRRPATTSRAYRRERGTGQAPCYAVRRTVSPVRVHSPVRYTPAPRIGRARVGIEPGAMKPGQRIWSPMRLLGPVYMAPALRMVSPVHQHSPVWAIPPRCTGLATGSIQPGKVGQARCSRAPVCLHGPICPVPPPRTSPPVAAPRTRLSLCLLPTGAPDCPALTEPSSSPALPESPVCPELPESPVCPELPESPVCPELPESPVCPELPESPVCPELPESPVCPELPESPVCPELPESPVCPELPESPVCPELPESPVCPELPESPVCPELPESPACPSLPESPACPSLPESPACPSLPESPACPSLPESPACPSLPESPACPSLPESPVHLGPVARVLSPRSAAWVAALKRPRRRIERRRKTMVELGQRPVHRAATADRHPPRPSPIGLGFAAGVRTFGGGGVLSRSDHSSVIYSLFKYGQGVSWVGSPCWFFYVGF
uniref:Uncharacterized protein n=1 Tax=Oncorhynchus kisutch TaxID=8019 RepID=A0A8C7HKJ1_ONCKI